MPPPSDGDRANDYVASRWVAERMAIHARERGLPVAIYRVVGLAGNSAGRAWHRGGLMRQVMWAALSLGCAPQQCHWMFDATPIDFAVAALVQLAVREPFRSLGQLLHVQAPINELDGCEVEPGPGGNKSLRPASVSANELFEWMGFQEHQRVQLGDWQELVAVAASVSPEGSPLRGVQQALADDRISWQLEHMPPMLDSTLFHAALVGTGVRYPVVDRMLIQLYVLQLHKAGAPQRRTVPTSASILKHGIAERNCEASVSRIRNEACSNVTNGCLVQ